MSGEQELPPVSGQPAASSVPTFTQAQRLRKHSKRCSFLQASRREPSRPALADSFRENVSSFVYPLGTLGNRSTLKRAASPEASSSSELVIGIVSVVKSRFAFKDMPANPSNVLCREKLNHILRLLKDGPVGVRHLWLFHKVCEWELEEAQRLGWIRIFFRESPKGRPARMAESTERDDAKLPPRRREIGEISFRHETFARRSVYESVKGGMRFAGYCLPPLYMACLRTYPRLSRRRAVATAATAQLMRRREVQAARAWYYAVMNREILRDEPMPRTVMGIRARLTEVGSHYVRRL
jgi:hypothetical protein